MAREKKFSTEELFQETEQILLQHGYEGFTFSMLAKRINVSRGAIYKYYENKEELLFDYMIYEMEKFLLDLREIENHEGFMAQFDFLMDIFFKKTEIHTILSIAQQIPTQLNEKVKEKKGKLDQYHMDMYKHLQNFITLGKEEGKLKSHIPSVLMLGYIFQSITIPNHFGIPKSQWIHSIKEIIGQGMFNNN
jgi:TetR/AcrR family transcriptional regulator, repressor of fatR-cypB operon